MLLRRIDSPARLSRLALSASVISALACLAQPVLAQTSAPQVVVTKPAPPVKKEEKAEAPPAPDAGIEATVTVTGNRPTNRIDRQVYDVKNDVGATNGSAADALNNVPSVAVDPDGTLTLRGSSNVQILIDGKPSAMLQGDNRGATLNALPAEDIESIEVINNPGAQFGNEAGSGPILNIVMKRTRKPGGFGALNANAGSAGRYNSALSGSYNTGRFGMQGGVNFRHDGRNSVAHADRARIDPLTGIASHSTQQSRSTGLNDAAGFNSALTYNLGAKDTLGANLAYAHRTNDQQSDDRYVNFGQDDIADSDYVRTARREGSSENYTWGARYDHKGERSGELAKLDLRVSSSVNASDSAYANAYAIRPAGVPDARNLQDNRTETRFVDFTGDYERPDEQGVLKLGYKVASHKNSFDTRYTNIDPATLAETPNALRSNRFALDEGNLALYGSYQLRLNEYWGVLAGLRAEYTSMDIVQLTSAMEAANRYINYIPSFFVSYKASDKTNIRFSYAHRIRRPNANDLNPFVVYRDEFNVSSGNPNLKPTQTDSFELGYETRVGALDTNLRGYYRKDTGLISERKVFVSDTVLLTTRDNAGNNQAGGLEFTLSGKLLPTLSINTSGNLAYSEQRIFNSITGIDTKRSANSLSGRARFNYQMSDLDQLQVSLNAQGKTLFGQGYRQPNSTANVSFRHALTPALSLVLNVTDVFNSNKIETITDADLLRENNIRRYDGRVVYLGLSYRLGGVAPAGGRRNPNGPERPPAGMGGSGRGV
jgi:outer membrane receptor protein involved in Fe transport